MPQGARILMDGGTYHVLTRGNNGQVVFHDDADRQRYLQLLSTLFKEYELPLYHYALMPNHVHLVCLLPRAEALAPAMLRLNLTYALFYKARHGYAGHLWQGRFKSLLIDQERYLLACGRYIELNPVRARLVDEPQHYPWSSYRIYAQGLLNSLITPSPLYLGLGRTARERQQYYRDFVRDGMRGAGHAPGLPGQRQPRTLEEALGLARPKGRRGRPKKTSAHANQKMGNVPNFQGDGKN